MTPALLLIDIQNDYFGGGAMELDGSDIAVLQAAKLLECFRQKKLPIIHIQHIASRPDATFFLPGTDGADIHERVKPLETETMMVKHFPNSFRDTPLLSHLQTQHIDQLVIAGMMTHMCVDTTVRAAFDLGFTCTLAQDACATRSLTFHGQAVSAQQVQLAYLAALNGLFARVLPTTEICELV